MIEHEKTTISEMIDIYCSKKHKTAKGELCPECEDLLTYSHERLDRCRYGETKPTCRKCPTHCYRPAMRMRIKDVMRTAGPRLFFRAPLKWLLHSWRDRKRVEAAREVQKKEG